MINGIPTDAQRMNILMTVEEICKTKGKYVLNRYTSFNDFVKANVYKYSAYRTSLVNCMSSTKSVLSELVRWAQIDTNVTTSNRLKWFKSFLDMIVKAAKHGMMLATKFAKYILRLPIKESSFFKSVNVLTKGGWAGAMVVASTIFGIVAAVIIFAISLWLHATGKVLAPLSKDKSIWSIAKEKADKYMGTSDDDLPDEIEPPGANIPNVTMSYIHESFERSIDRMITESEHLTEGGMVIIAGAIFILFFKAAVSASFNEELEQKNQILRNAIPGKAFLTFISLLLLFGAASAAGLVA